MPDFEPKFITATDGVRLGLRIYPPAASSHNLPVICLPGLTRNARDFHQIALAISKNPIRPRRVVCLDYRGRGTSDRVPDPATYTVLQEAQDVLTVLDSLGIQRALFIGTSRGGLIIHILAQIALERLAAVVLNDVGPKLGLEGLKQIQSYLQQPVMLGSWHEAIQHLKQIHGESFPALEEADWRELADAVYRENGEIIEADCDPAISTSFATMPLNQPLPELWPQFELLRTVPTMVVRGEHSQLLTAEIVAEMASRHPQLDSTLAVGQGHAPLLHLNGVRQSLISFLDRI